MSVAPEVGVSLTALKRWVQLHRDAAAGAGGKPDEPVDTAKYKALEARLREVERKPPDDPWAISRTLRAVPGSRARDVGRTLWRCP